MVVQPETAADAMSNAIAVLFNALISNPKIRLFNGIPHISIHRLSPVTLLLIPLWLFRGSEGWFGRVEDAALSLIAPAPGRNGIAIRACFGKPAFACMQHGAAPTSPEPEGTTGLF
jgi:hypothetical protein